MSESKSAWKPGPGRIKIPFRKFQQTPKSLDAPKWIALQKKNYITAQYFLQYQNSH